MQWAGRKAGGMVQWSGRAGQGPPGWPHSLPLHLLLLPEDLVGFHRQPLLHQKLLSLQLALPELFQPLPVCHEQLPALMGRKEAPCSVPWEPRSPLPEFEGQDLGCLLISVPPMSGIVAPALSDPSFWLGRNPPQLLSELQGRRPLGLSHECVSEIRGLSSWAAGQGSRGPHQLVLDLQLRLRWRWSGCGYSSARSRPVGTGR